MLHLNKLLCAPLRLQFYEAPPQLWWFCFWYKVFKPIQMQLVLYILVKSCFIFYFEPNSYSNLSLVLLQNRPEQTFPNCFFSVGCIHHEIIKSAIAFEKENQRYGKRFIKKKKKTSSNNYN